MKAIKYKTTVHRSVLEAIHAGYGGHEITEIFIPEVGICFNIFDNILNVFESDGPRELVEERIEIDDELAEELVMYLQQKESLKKLCKSSLQG